MDYNNSIRELTNKVCAIKAKNKMERVEGLHDDIYKEFEKYSKATPVLNKLGREKK